MESSLLLYLHKNPHIIGNINLLTRYLNAKITNQHSKQILSLTTLKVSFAFSLTHTDINLKYNNTVRAATVDQPLSCSSRNTEDV